GLGQQFNFRKYNVEDGLAQSQVYALFQDRTGRMWMGTRGGGISVFDGFEFKNYTPRDGLNGNYIHDILADPSGTIWVASSKGLCYFNGSQFVQIPKPRETESFTVLDIFISTEGSLYTAGPQGIFQLKDKVLQQIVAPKEMKGASANCLYVHGKTLLIGTDRALFQMRSGRVEDLSESSPFMKNAITTIEKDGAGTYWIGTYGDGLYGWENKRFFRIDYHLELYRQSTMDIYVDAADNLWIATSSKGVLHYDKKTKTFVQISEAEGLSNNHVRTLFEDRNHSMWFGSSGGGVCHFLGKQFTNYDERSGLGGSFIYSVFRDSRGILWIGNSQRGVSTLGEHGFTRFDASNGFENVKVKALAEDREGTIWLGTDGQGVYTYRNEKFQPIDELSSTYVKAITTDDRGHVWIATAGTGLIEITPSSGNYLIEKWTVAAGALSSRITSLLRDTQGRLWYGSERDGLACISFVKNGPTSKRINVDLKGEEIRSLAQDAQGRIWIGTAGGGAYIFHPDHPERAQHISEDDGLLSANIYLITADRAGNMLVGSEKGLDHIFLNEKGGIKQIRHYGKLDGFTGVETCQNAVWKDPDGTLWFGTINGLSKFNPAELVTNGEAPVLSFRDIKLFYESLLVEHPVLFEGKQKTALQLSYAENHISFDFLGINLKRPEGVVYQWRLRGFDDNWSPPSRDRSILYSNLNPGHYVFEVKAANEDGIWSKEPLRFEFDIAAPYWQKPWFLWFVGLSLLILLWTSYRFSMQRVRKKAAARQQQLALEKDFIELEQKAMRLQMNPHFIFNALNSIQSLIGTGKETEARYYLAKFSRLMRQILDNSRKSTISLDEEIHSLENYLLIEQFCNAERFNYSIEVDESMEKDFIKLPPMLIQPFVENAIKHGMKGRSETDGKGTIRIQFEEKNNLLICTIEDNGIGRKASAVLNESSQETYHTSTGLSVTAERLKRMASESTEEPLEIIDLYEAGVACGTRVILRIPIE
ncbi:MAG: hypothetical protein A3D92_14970, partial [Bacteroidetes bacterium RIFCSPHIGHO2_02_FULL_44_7]